MKCGRCNKPRDQSDMVMVYIGQDEYEICNTCNNEIQEEHDRRPGDDL